MMERYINPHTDFGFKRLFEQEDNPQELRSYEDSVNAYRDIVNAINTAEKKKFAEGMAEGMAKGMAEGVAKVARAMLDRGMDAAMVAELTGLTPEQLDGIVPGKELTTPE